MDTVVLYTIAIALFNLVLILLAILTWWLMKSPKKESEGMSGEQYTTGVAAVGESVETNLEGLFQFDSWYNASAGDGFGPRNGRASVSDN